MSTPVLSYFATRGRPLASGALPCFLLGLLGTPATFCFVAIPLLFDSTEIPYWFGPIGAMLSFACMIAPHIGCYFIGAGALREINQAAGYLAGRGWVIAGLAIASFWSVLVFMLPLFLVVYH